MKAPAIANFEFCGLSFTTGPFDDIARSISSICASQPLHRSQILIHINIYNFYQLQKSALIQHFPKEDCTLFFDGIGMKAGAALNGRGWWPDLNGTDLFPRVMRIRDGRRKRIFCLGSTSDSIEKAVSNICHQFDAIDVVGFHHGYFEPADEQAIVNMINRSQPDILLVGMGCPRQEAFIIAQRHALRSMVIWAVGGLFDYLSGTRPRAPVWVRRLRMEWFFRLVREPRRMWFRNLISFPYLLFFTLKQTKRKTRALPERSCNTTGNQI